jgi:hypothetical protein
VTYRFENLHRREVDAKTAKQLDSVPWVDDGRGYIRRETTIKYQGDLYTLYEAKYVCADCRRDYDGVYMVHDRLWRKYGIDGHLCPPCLGKRMGRDITMKDLNSAPCNSMGWSNETLKRPNYGPVIPPVDVLNAEITP